MFMAALCIIFSANYAALIGWCFTLIPQEGPKQGPTTLIPKISRQDFQLLFVLENQAITYFYSGQSLILYLLYLDGFRRHINAHQDISLTKSASREPTKVLVQDENVEFKNIVQSHN